MSAKVSSRGILWIGLLEAERLTCPAHQWLLELDGPDGIQVVAHNGREFTSPFLAMSELEAQVS